MRSPRIVDRVPVGDGRMPVPRASGSPIILSGKPAHRAVARR